MQLTYFSDPVCPWCWIGKRRLEKAIRNLGLENEVVWNLRAYELGLRDAPQETVVKHLQRKYGGTEADVQRMFERVRGIGAEEGLHFDFEKAIFASTFDAHRLLKWARESGKDRELLERFHRAHFNEAVNLADHAALARMAGEVGLDAAAAAKVLAGKEYGDGVDAEIKEAWEIGVTGVPYLVLADKFAVSGAQPVEVFERALRQALAGY